MCHMSQDLYYDQLAQGPLSESNRLEFEDHVAQTLNISGSNNRGDVAIALSGIIVSGPPAELICCCIIADFNSTFERRLLLNDAIRFLFKS